MPYFQVRVSQDSSTHFVVIAPNREAAADLALKHSGGEPCNNKTIVRAHSDNSNGVDVSESNHEAWQAALQHRIDSDGNGLC